MFKRIRKPLITLFILHLTVGFLHLMFFDLGHPLNQFITNQSLTLQVASISAYALVLYMVGGYLVMIGLDKDSDQMMGIGRVLVLMMMIFLIFFLIIFTFYIFNGRQSSWLLYSVVNPLFGTAMYNRVPEALIGLVWSVSSVIPGIGVLVGMIFGVRKGKKE